MPKLDLILLLSLGWSLLVAILYSSKLRAVATDAPKISLAVAPLVSSLSVIIPVYNEVENIEDCVLSVLNSTIAPIELWVVNDQSTDATWTVLQALQQRSDPRLKLLQGQPRPTDEVWVGKNWACTQASEQASVQATAEFLLFIDADVRLKSGAIETALQTMQQEQVDLLSCSPAIHCGCLSEWLVQPLIMSTILIGFNFTAVNDPATETAFAAGPFMLFRRRAYDKIGGHRSVADQVVEDVELSRRIKFNGLKLKFALGTDLATLRMYRSGAALWEGWTKNFYLGTQRNFRGVLTFIGLLLMMCTVPWVGLIVGTSQLVMHGFNGSNRLALVAILLSLLVIALQYDLRRRLAVVLGIAPRYWWLTGLGGLIVTVIAIASIIKTETGWGWTWRGRPLKAPS